MKQNVLDVLIYLFENCMDEDGDPALDQPALAAQLAEVGFPGNAVERAFGWLEDLTARCADHGSVIGNGRPSALRCYLDEEQEILGKAGRGFLLFLEQRGILDPFTRETVIDRVMALESEAVDLEQLKWIIMMVIYNQPGREGSYALMEDMVYDETRGQLH